MNLVAGATGMVGSEICNLLIKAGKPVRAMVRETSDQSKIENLKELGVEIVKGDPINMDETLKTFPLQLTSVENYAVSL